jgi:two-component system, cell cycle sensor histidine kinase and response regulator CckA
VECSGTVLLVEDDEAMCDLEKRILNRHGMGTVCVNKVGDAIEQLKTNSFSAVLLDYRLPDGLCWPVLAVAKESRIPVILVTGMGDERIAVEAMQQGAANYVSKSGQFLDQLPEILKRAIKQHRVERELENTSLRLQSAVRASNTGLWDWNIGTDTIIYSSEWKRQLGYGDADIENRLNEWYDRLHPEDLERVRDSVQTYMAGKSQTFEVEQRLRCKDGQIKWFLTRGTSITDPGGKAIRMLGSNVDITELKRAEEALLEKSNIAELSAEIATAMTTADSLDHALMSTTRSLVRHKNAVLARIWTLDRSRKLLTQCAASSSYSGTLPEETPNGQAAAIEQIADNKKPLLINNLDEDRRLDKEWLKSAQVAAFAGFPLLINGKLLGVMVLYSRSAISNFTYKSLCALADTIALGINRKLTEQMKGELETRLQQAQKMEAIGQLAGGIAHDFNNMLTVIIGHTELLLSRINDEKLRGQLTTIYRTGERAAALTRQMLAFSRQQVLAPKVIDLNSIIVESQKMLQRLIPENIIFTSRLDPHLERVKADPSQIDQVVINLIVNARDAMPGGGTLTIETRNTEISEEDVKSHPDVSPGKYVCVSVIDTGHGMDSATMARIFEPFFTTKEPGKGTGLGLATLFGIVKQSNGHVEVFSDVGKGTTFNVYLPTTVEMAAAVTSSKLVAVPAGQECVLVVEDEEGVRDLMQELLKACGYSILIAKNGREALEICKTQRERINLIVTDMIMPEMGGLELIERAKKACPDAKVLYTSGYVDHAFIKNGELTEGVEYLQKPYTPFGLIRKVRQILDNSVDTGT